jgi:hypothetical protein
MSVVPFALEGFEMQPFTASNGRKRDVYRTGEGPAVIIIHEVPGITPDVAAFARRVADSGMTAVLPNLLGTPGRPMTIPYALSSFARACVSKEFTLLALNKTSPIVDYLRDLAKNEHEACGGPGVGAPDIKRVPRWILRYPTSARSPFVSMSSPWSLVAMIGLLPMSRCDWPSRPRQYWTRRSARLYTSRWRDFSLGT